MWKKLFSILLLSLSLTSCTNIDCPLENVVMMHCGLYDSEKEETLTLTDTLTITAVGADAVLWNKGYDISELSLPLRINGNVDTLLLRFSNANEQTAIDTLFIHHTSNIHFESIDCPASVFHTITAVRHTSHDLNLMPLTLDSVAVLRRNVDYGTNQNLKLYLRTPAL